jgi:hypothetical protein
VSASADHYTNALLAEKERHWLSDYELFGNVGEDPMTRVSTLAVSEIAKRLKVPEQRVLLWIVQHSIESKRDSVGVIRVPLLEYPVLVELSKGEPIEKARAVVADVKERLEARPR